MVGDELAEHGDAPKHNLKTSAEIVSYYDDSLPTHSPPFTGGDCVNFRESLWIFCHCVVINITFCLGVFAVVVDEYHLAQAQYIHLLCNGDEELEPARATWIARTLQAVLVTLRKNLS